MNLSPSNTDREALIGQAALMTMAFSGVDLTPLGARLLERANSHPHDANTLMDLSTLLQLIGKPEIALTVQAQALEMQRLYHLPAATGETGIRLLAIMGPGDFMTNTPLDFLLKGSDVSLDMLYVGAEGELPETLPEHDVIFVALGEADEHLPLLAGIERRLSAWSGPLLNRPEAAAGLSRDNAYRKLHSAPGIAMPITARIDRATLEKIGCAEKPIGEVLEGGHFPVIARPVGSHAGRGLSRLDQPSDIPGYLKTLSDSEFYVSPFVDYRSADGLFRKYRVVLIAGRAYACHMGISGHWMIHYLNAGMAESADKRAEEERFMADFATDFGRRHEEAFRAIFARMDLDYLVVDCAETQDGRLLIFELDSGAVVHDMDPADLFPYKPAQMRKVFAAFREMLARAMKPAL